MPLSPNFFLPPISDATIAKARRSPWKSNIGYNNAGKRLSFWYTANCGRARDGTLAFEFTINDCSLGNVSETVLRLHLFAKPKPVCRRGVDYE